jgi:hypothetical protein
MAVFHVLGVAISATSIEPFESAIAALSPERMNALLAHRSGAHRRDGFSLFHFRNDRGKLPPDT